MHLSCVDLVTTNLYYTFIYTVTILRSSRSADSVISEDQFPGSCLRKQSPYKVKGEKFWSLWLLTRTLSPSWGLCPHDLLFFPKSWLLKSAQNVSSWKDWLYLYTDLCLNSHSKYDYKTM